jgi:hypothetical protein
MKSYFIAAGALLLGTSALAWAPDMISNDPYVEKPAPTLAGTMTEAAYDYMAAAPLPLETTDSTWDTTTDKLAYAEGWAVKDMDPASAKLQTVAFDPYADKASDPYADKMAAKDMGAYDPAVDTVVDDPVADTWVDDPVASDTFVDDPVVADSSAVDTYGPTDVYAGMGGPELDTTPRPAAGNYPPCSPGPGDDNCIQLYEPGVRAQLASWTGATGGLAGSEQAMGGPFEPADDLASSDPVTSDLDSQTYADVPAMETGTYAETADPAVGVGGPIESRSDYPPCDPGPGDDRCIQLYERGVTGL